MFTAGQSWPKLRGMRVSKSDWTKLVDHVRAATGAPFSEMDCLRMYDICPIGAVSQFSLAALNLFGATGGLSRVATPEQYGKLSSVYADACVVISEQVERVKERKSHDR
jgi:hypothetical protein